MKGTYQHTRLERRYQRSRHAVLKTSALAHRGGNKASTLGVLIKQFMSDRSGGGQLRKEV